MDSWWNEPSGEGDTVFLIVEAKLHNPSAWKRDVLARTSVLVSSAVSALMGRIERDLTITWDTEDPEKLASADLVFTVDAERAERVRDLLAQKKFDKKTGEPRIFSNAYRFVACEPMDDGRCRVTSRLAIGIWKEKENARGERVRTHVVSRINAKKGFQQLLATYYAASLLRSVPTALRAGVCQEVAQQVESYLGQLASSKVKGEVNFPTVEDRDPARRQRAYEDAIDALCRDLRPLTHAKLRDVFPGEYATDDPKGDRLIVHDERWFAVTRSPEPWPIPLLFTEGKSLQLLEGSARFDAGVSKANRHRRVHRGMIDVSNDRPAIVLHKGSTGAQAWFAAIPLLDAEDELIRKAIRHRMPGSGRNLDLHLRRLPIQGGGAWMANDRMMLVPISGNRDRLERILRRRDLEIAWSRLVCKNGDWFLQLTLRVGTPAHVATNRILGIAFGLDAVATWHLVDGEGNQIATGAIAPNEQIRVFIEQKLVLEWHQGKGRWIGGSAFGERLEAIAHGVANQLVALATQHNARLAVEDIAYVQKAGRDPAANVLFSAWNYAQLRRILDYKAPLRGQDEPLYASDYVTNLTCPACGAMRGKGQTHDRATTWRENGTLHCRNCGWSGEVTPAMRAERVACHALSILS